MVKQDQTIECDFVTKKEDKFGLKIIDFRFQKFYLYYFN